MTRDHGIRSKWYSTANADGSEKLPPFVIGKAERPRAFDKKTGDQLGFYYRSNAKAWMTVALYRDWLLSWDSELRAAKRHVILLQDNFSGHIEPEGLTNIRVENFRPNLTAHVQPNDAGIIRCFKAHYRGKFISRAIDRYDGGVTPALIYDLDQLEAMRLADAAWRDVGSQTIANCWRKTGILPDTASADRVDAGLGCAEEQVTNTLKELVERGVLVARNRMAIDELLNPVGPNAESESSMMDGSTLMQILECVQERHSVAAAENDVEPEILPTRKEALAAVATLSKFISVANTPFARKLEGMIATFGRETRLDMAKSMHDTEITEYFVPKEA